ncbi:MAG TPA: hypothetical protein VGF67_08015 [Ktedonobacteraceae bacterium]|jgi:hypothetical protein
MIYRRKTSPGLLFYAYAMSAPGMASDDKSLVSTDTLLVRYYPQDVQRVAIVAVIWRERMRGSSAVFYISVS